MNNVIFTYDQESAMNAGQSGFINESGAYVLTISEAKLTKSQHGAEFIEFSGEADDGRKVSYLSICCKKKDGSVNSFGQSMVQAIMGCCGVRQVTSHMISTSHVIAPEFAGKRVGLVLQKILRTKNNGDDTYGMDIRIPFYPDTRQTIAEKVEGKPATTIDKMVANLKDKDERKTNVQHYSGQQSNGFLEAPRQPQGQPPMDFDDDIPF
ncbi:hypothetical protein AB204_13020 [Xenorhabdus khoisanae]|uniref:DUF669 domain-containing protein n=1 Tax=Xenorhabdus khoisanae TaxID=880157 RepID=A0A0J5FQW0_9GAMM|nr:hypothetical protein [Xenorhabdus khoisanae]KMJ44691.1 hypothetical protein AB204_13020 [Xenorhabdus khoisanae]